MYSSKFITQCLCDEVQSNTSLQIFLRLEDVKVLQLVGRCSTGVSESGADKQALCRATLVESNPSEDQGWCITPIPPLSPLLQEQPQGPRVPQMDVLQGCHKAAEAAGKGSRQVELHKLFCNVC